MKGDYLKVWKIAQYTPISLLSPGAMRDPRSRLEEKISKYKELIALYSSLSEEAREEIKPYILGDCNQK